MTLARSSSHRYHLYGVSLASRWPLPYRQAEAPALARVELRRGSTKQFPRMRKLRSDRPGGAAWCQHERLADSSVHLRWPGHFEVLVAADGHRIFYRALSAISTETFDSYLLGPALSFALLKFGIEPLHATTVVIEGRAVGFLGDCGYGKSSLAAAFVREGHPLLTDDLLVVTDASRHLVAHPGPPRLKLLPEVARRLFGSRARRALKSDLTPKLMISLGPDESCSRAVALKALYALGAPTGRTVQAVTIRRLAGRDAFLALVRNTFNTLVTEPARLERQLHWCARLTSSISIKTLTYPRTWSALASVRAAILADLAS
jgi:hypothetical protein